MNKVSKQVSEYEYTLLEKLQDIVDASTSPCNEHLYGAICNVETISEIGIKASQWDNEEEIHSRLLRYLVMIKPSSLDEALHLLKIIKAEMNVV
jgi:hypothetical protein